MSNEILLLSEEDVISVLTIVDALEAVENAFREKGLGTIQMPPKIYVNFAKYGGDFRSMPSYFENLDIAGIKVVNAHPNNPRLYGKPTVMATIILLDPRNGVPLSIMSGAYLTAMRTGAAGGLATKYLARKGSKVLGLVGTGVQAKTQFQAINEVMTLDEVRCYDVADKTLENCCREISDYGSNVTPCKSIKECIEFADVISTTTPVNSPIIKADWIRSGMHINAIGADAEGKQELDPDIVKNAKIIVDDMNQACHSGEVNVPLSRGIITEEDIYAELGEVVVGKKQGRHNDLEITIFDSTGLSLQDVSTAAIVFEKAKKKNVGKWITL
ncbi:MAG: alanine dehydrogenase [Candidatus Bathyarchaeota archaeon]|nr:MAG: alanine dehydrogenase [Candidatus Bathyarchaeota archaeon]